MARRDIVAIGGSLGAVEAVRDLCRTLPADLAGSIAIVLHVGAGGRNLLAGIRPKLPAHVARRLVGEEKGETVIGVDLSGPDAGYLLAGLSGELPGGFRLIHGGIDHIQEHSVARFFIGVPSAEGPDRAVAYLERHGAKVEVLGHVHGHA